MQEGATRCEACGSDYDLLETITVGASRMIDGFECVIHPLALICERCDAGVAEHSVQVGGAFFCCVHCVGRPGMSGVRDRA